MAYAAILWQFLSDYLLFCPKQKSPEKLEPKYPDQPINDDDDLENETELFHSIEDISMAMDPVESENLFSLEHEFDIDSNMLS